MYALPPDNSILGLMHSAVPRPQPNVAQALRVLKDYAHRIDTGELVNNVSCCLYLFDSICLFVVNSLLISSFLFNFFF